VPWSASDTSRCGAFPSDRSQQPVPVCHPGRDRRRLFRRCGGPSRFPARLRPERSAARLLPHTAGERAGPVHLRLLPGHLLDRGRCLRARGGAADLDRAALPAPADGHRATKQTHGHSGLEIVWTLIPAIIVTALFAFTVDTLGKVETANTPGDNPALTIDVTGFQWQWTFDYKAQGISLTGTGRDGPTMAIPVGEKVRIRLHATDVIHSFYVPQFLYKKDAIPGRVNEFDVIVQQVGTYAGQCAEFCGIGHADMHFTVAAMTPADFDAWVAQQQQPSTQRAALPARRRSA
jgi:cytochrome c oxidase subunit II